MSNSEINFSGLLRTLVVDYFEQRISRVEYLARRRSMLDRVDHEFNGLDDSTQWPESDTTQPTSVGPDVDTTNVPPGNRARHSANSGDEASVVSFDSQSLEESLGQGLDQSLEASLDQALEGDEDDTNVPLVEQTSKIESDEDQVKAQTSRQDNLDDEDPPLPI